MDDYRFISSRIYYYIQRSIRISKYQVCNYQRYVIYGWKLLSFIRIFSFVEYLVKRFVMFTSSSAEPRNFESVAEKSICWIISLMKILTNYFFFNILAIANNQNDLQVTEIVLDRSFEARHFKCVILAGYDSFASVHSLQLDASRGRGGRRN